MALISRKVGKVSLVAAILLASMAFCAVGLLAPARSGGTDGGGALLAAGSPVTAIDVAASVSKNPATVGEQVTVSGRVTLVGGPTQVKFTFTVPQGTDTYEASFETTLDENGHWGFTSPPFEIGGTPGTYTATIKAEAGGLSDVEQISFTLLPGPEM